MTTSLTEATNPASSVKSVSNIRYDCVYNTQSVHSTTNWSSLDSHDGGKVTHVSEKTPGFHKLLSSGKLVPHTRHKVSREKVESVLPLSIPVACQPSYGSIVQPPSASPVGGITEYTAVFPDHSTPDFSPLLLKALGEANTGATLVLLELAESPKVVDLIFNFRSRLTKRVEKLQRLVKRRYKPKTALEFTKVFGDTWLEYRYGWRQLYYASEDIVRSLEVLSQEKHFVVSTGRAYESDTVGGQLQNLTITPHSVLLTPTIQQSSVTSTRELRAVVSLQISKTLASADYNLVGLGWELVPYSFVVDWFVNVGDVCRAIWPVPTMAKSAATSVKTVRKMSVSYGTATGGFPSTTGVYTHTREEYDRTPHSGDIPANLRINPNLGLAKILDAISLTVGKHRSFGKNPFRI